MKKYLLPTLNTLALFAMLFINALGGSGKLNGKSMAELSAKYDTLITPAGYAFSIWGFIFILLILLTVYQWIQVNQPDAPVNKITGSWLLVSHLANAVWVQVWMSEFLWLSVFHMLILLTSLIVMARRVTELPAQHQTNNFIFVGLPIAVYLGWIAIATVVNIAAVLGTFLSPDSYLFERAIALGMLVLATGIYFFVMRLPYLGAVGWVGVWAFMAIAVRFFERDASIAIPAGALAAFLMVMTGLNTLKRLRKNWKTGGVPS
jgi:hypothetical protein